MAELAEKIEILADALRSSQRVAVLTGAGASQESGVPTFRGAEGLWKGKNPMEMASMEAFLADPAGVWEWYDWRRGQLAQCKPNPGHVALAELESKVEDFLLVTQNVDGLHQAAGSKKMVELHGDIWTLKCVKECGYKTLNKSPSIAKLPRCPTCEEYLRPGVVWFGESLPEEGLIQAHAAATQAEVFLVVGTSAVVFPAAGLATVARRSGAKVFEINPYPVQKKTTTVVLKGLSGEILPQVLEKMY